MSLKGGFILCLFDESISLDHKTIEFNNTHSYLGYQKNIRGVLGLAVSLQSGVKNRKFNSRIIRIRQKYYIVHPFRWARIAWMCHIELIFYAVQKLNLLLSSPNLQIWISRILLRAFGDTLQVRLSWKILLNLSIFENLRSWSF